MKLTESLPKCIMSGKVINCSMYTWRLYISISNACWIYGDIWGFSVTGVVLMRLQDFQIIYYEQPNKEWSWGCSICFCICMYLMISFDWLIIWWFSSNWLIFIVIYEASLQCLCVWVMYVWQYRLKPLFKVLTLPRDWHDTWYPS